MCSPSAGPPRRMPVGRRGETRGGSRLAQPAGAGVLGLHHDAVRDHLRMLDHPAARQHRRAGHALGGQAFQPFRGRTGQQHLLRHRQPFVDVLLPQRRRLEARIVQPFRTIQRAGQRRPFTVGLHRGADVVVGGLRRSGR